ncbi:uncharacterized protein LOC118751576 [Rhagoletis pomonella]|uniref:uncharacterized protein LOC118751576 n=1 Tax=Rhagoletis pomonella TaxID=28610 RepID=UPI00177EC9C6|nr:uncharacterized protein LOC118751576 [Rhagoletis pomonella]
MPTIRETSANMLLSISAIEATKHLSETSGNITITEMKRNEIEEWLNCNNIKFNVNATLRQLRKLAIENGATCHISCDNSEESDHSSIGDNSVTFAECTTADHKRKMEEKATPPSSNEAGRANRLKEIETEEMLINTEIKLLQKKRLFNELRVNNGKNCAEFSDITHAIVPYPGADAYDANKWIADFERICDSVNGDEIFKFKCVRRLMKPDSEADLFLRLDRSTTYAAFKGQFLRTFGQSYSVVEIVNLLKTTLFDPKKMTVLRYIFKMQEIAARASMDEVQTIQLIIEGFRDDSSDIAVLDPATTIDHLKQLSRSYGQMRNKRSNTSSKTSTSIKVITSSVRSANTLRCYNCSGFGHVSSSCTEPKRERGSCFRCGSTSHIIKQCNLKANETTNPLLWRMSSVASS